MSICPRFLFFVFLALFFVDSIVSSGESPAIWTTSIEKLAPALCNENGVYVGRDNMKNMIDIENALDKVFPDKLKGDIDGPFRQIKYLDVKNNLIYTLLFTDDIVRVVILEKPLRTEDDSEYILKNLIPRIETNFDWSAVVTVNIKTMEMGEDAYIEAIRPVQFQRYVLKENNQVVLWYFFANMSSRYVAAENMEVFNRLIRALGGDEINAEST